MLSLKIIVSVLVLVLTQVTPRNACPSKISHFYNGNAQVGYTTSFYKANQLLKNTYLGTGGLSLSNDVFTAPRANLLIGVEGVDASILPNSKLDGISFFPKATDQKCVSTGSLAKFVTLLTGQSRHQHKVVGNLLVNKNGVEALAYSRQGTTHEHDALVDLVIAKNANTHVVSVSTKSTFANAAKPLRYHANSHVYSWDDSQRQFNDKLNSKYIEARINKFVSKFPKSSFNSETGIVHLIVGDNEAKYNLKEASDFIFFAEIIGFAKILKSELKRSASVDVPALYTVVFASPMDLALKYGISEKYVTALHVLNAIIPKMISKFTDAYKGRTTAEIALLGGLAIQIKNSDLHLALKDNLIAPLDKHFPSIYTKEESPQICEQVKNVLNQDFKVTCGGMTERQIIRKLLQFDLLQTSNSTNSNSTTATTLDVAEWQTLLWTGIGMIIAFIIAVILVGSIDGDDITSWIIVDIQEKINQ